MKKIHYFLTLGLITLFTLNVSAQIIILSGPEMGTYHQYVEDMAKVFEDDTAFTILNKNTQGAANNFAELSNPDSDYKIALVQADYLYMMQGLDLRDNKTTTENLRVLLPLANEEIHIVTKSTSDLNTFRDLDGKTIAVGSNGQGTYATARQLQLKSDIKWRPQNGHFDQSMEDLKLDKIDAFMIVAGAPIEKLDYNPAIAIEQLKLVEVVGDGAWAKYYTVDTINKETYQWLDKDIPTFGVKTLLMVNEAKLTEKDREDIVRLIEGLNANMQSLKKNGHPKWKEVDFEDWNSNNFPVYKN